MPKSELPIDKDRPIIDAHHHLWDVGQGHSKPTQAFFMEDLAREARDHNVVASVYLQVGASYLDTGPAALRPVGETEFAAAQAGGFAGSPRLGAIVGWADMTLGDAVEEILQAHEVAGQGLFRGIRFATVQDPNFSHGPPRPAGLLRRADVRRALSCLGRLGHSFDAYVYHPQLPELAETIRATEATSFIVNQRQCRIRSST